MVAVGAMIGGACAVVYEAVNYWQGTKVVDKISNIASAALSGGLFIGGGKLIVDSGITAVLLLKECLSDSDIECTALHYAYIGVVALPFICTVSACLALFHPPKETAPLESIETVPSSTAPIHNQ